MSKVPQPIDIMSTVASGARWPPETTGDPPGSPSSRNRKSSHCLISPAHQACNHLFPIISSVIRMPLHPQVQRTQQPQTPHLRHPPNPFFPATGSEFAYTYSRTMTWSCPLPGPGQNLLGTSPTPRPGLAPPRERALWGSLPEITQLPIWRNRRQLVSYGVF